MILGILLNYLCLVSSPVKLALNTFQSCLRLDIWYKVKHNRVWFRGRWSRQIPLCLSHCTQPQLLNRKREAAIWRLWKVNGRKTEGRNQNSEFHKIHSEFASFPLPVSPGLDSKEAWNPEVCTRGGQKGLQEKLAPPHLFLLVQGAGKGTHKVGEGRKKTLDFFLFSPSLDTGNTVPAAAAAAQSWQGSRAGS